MKSRIKELAEAKGMSLWRLSTITGLTSNAFYKWERVGLSKAQLGALVKVAKALNCRVEDLFSE